METIDMLINEIESEVLKAKKAAFSNTDIVINKAVMLDLISRFRASYPLVLREATQIKKDRDDIIQKAENYANETMDKAEEQAKQLMTETEVFKRAKAEAEAKATQMVSEAIASGDTKAINYFIAQKYTEALKQIGGSPNSKVVMMPLEAGNLIGSVAGIAELLKGDKKA